ncbi:MAG: hypothetical protein LBE18_04815, partial [Planctomycetaceae bacterium]|nr:hypothetical protein [Planctomycetaceae bacterium]
MKLPQELLSFYSKSKPAGNNQIKHKISQFSRFGHLKLRLILRLILHLILRLNLHLLLTTFALIQFFYPIQKANAIFSDNEISRTNI